MSAASPHPAPPPPAREGATSTTGTANSLSRKRGRAGVGAASAQPLAIYIHWPFCRSKCPYCDFNSHVRERIDEVAWTGALLADLDRQARLAPDREVVSIF